MGSSFKTAFLVLALNISNSSWAQSPPVALTASQNVYHCIESEIPKLGELKKIVEDKIAAIPARKASAKENQRSTIYFEQVRDFLGTLISHKSIALMDMRSYWYILKKGIDEGNETIEKVGLAFPEDEAPLRNSQFLAKYAHLQFSYPSCLLEMKAWKKAANYIPRR